MYEAESGRTTHLRQGYGGHGKFLPVGGVRRNASRVASGKNAGIRHAGRAETSRFVGIRHNKNVLPHWQYFLASGAFSISFSVRRDAEHGTRDACAPRDKGTAHRSPLTAHFGNHGWTRMNTEKTKGTMRLMADDLTQVVDFPHLRAIIFVARGGFSDLGKALSPVAWEAFCG